MSKCGIDLAKQDDCRELDELEMKSVRGSDPREDSALTTISLTDFDVGHDFALALDLRSAAVRTCSLASSWGQRSRW